MANKFILSKVMEAVEESKAAIEKEREKRVEKIYAEYMKPRKKYWLFGPLVTRTRDEAIEAAEQNDDSYFRLEVAKEAYCGWLNELKKIEDAAVALKDRCFTDINLTIEEFAQVAPFYKVGD
jgi:hypothetical protein